MIMSKFLLFGGLRTMSYVYFHDHLQAGCKMALSPWLLALILISRIATAAEPMSSGNVQKPPQDYLEIVTEIDPKCQILSEGGKINLLKNHHPDKTILYRLQRYFAGIKQAGLVSDSLAPGATATLGCNKVDKREQSWQITAAKLVP